MLLKRIINHSWINKFFLGITLSLAKLDFPGDKAAQLQVNTCNQAVCLLLLCGVHMWTCCLSSPPTAYYVYQGTGLFLDFSSSSSGRRWLPIFHYTFSSPWKIMEQIHILSYIIPGIWSILVKSKIDDARGKMCRNFIQFINL